MRLVMHHRTQGHGVESVHLLGMAHAFERAGYDVTIVSPPGVALGAEGAAPARGRGVRGLWYVLAERLPEIFFEGLEIAYNATALVRVGAALRGARARALYERYAFFNVAGAMASRMARVPLVLEVNFTTSTDLYRRRSRLLMPLARLAERYAFRSAAVINCVTGELARQVVAAGVDPRRVVVTPNAADPERFRPEISAAGVRARYGLGGGPVIGFTGAFFKWHGVDFLLSTLPAVFARVPDARVLLVGDGPERASLEATVREQGWAERVRFSGWVSHEALPEHIAAFDVAAQPDANEYASPVKIYEYMAMGKPVVAPRIGPLEEGIVEGETGILFQRRERASLESALMTLLEDASLRARMGGEARAHILRHHTWDRNATRVLERLEALDAPGNAGAGNGNQAPRMWYH